jgi:hypothetical protein
MSVECVGFSKGAFRWAASGGMDKTLKVSSRPSSDPPSLTAPLLISLSNCTVTHLAIPLTLSLLYLLLITSLLSHPSSPSISPSLPSPLGVGYSHGLLPLNLPSRRLSGLPQVARLTPHHHHGSSGPYSEGVGRESWYVCSKSVLCAV